MQDQDNIVVDSRSSRILWDVGHYNSRPQLLSSASCEFHSPVTVAARTTLQCDMGSSSTQHHCCQRTNHQRNVSPQPNSHSGPDQLQHPHHNCSHGQSTLTRLQNKTRLYLSLFLLCLLCQLQSLAAQTTVGPTQTIEGVPERCFTNVAALCGSSFSLKYKYNHEDRSCAQYLHSGDLCEWQEEINEEVNSFDTLEECQAVCAGSFTSRTDSTEPTDDYSICFLELENDLHNCVATFPSTHYHYDHMTMECVPFLSFGCELNENNFFSRQDCIDQCLDPLTPTPTPLTTPNPTSPTPTPLTTVSVSTGDPSPTPSQTTSPTYKETAAPPTSTVTTTTTITMTTVVTETTPTHDGMNLPESTPPPVVPDCSTTVTTATTGDQLGDGSLTTFDYASIAIGMIAFSLVVLLIVLVATVLYKQRRRLKVTKGEVMDSRDTKTVQAYKPSLYKGQSSVHSPQTKLTSNSQTPSQGHCYVSTV